MNDADSGEKEVTFGYPNNDDEDRRRWKKTEWKWCPSQSNQTNNNNKKPAAFGSMNRSLIHREKMKWK